MGKLSSILLGTVSGAALALFLTSDKGKQVCSQAQDFLDDLREDPEYAKEQVCEKLTEVKEQATDFVLKTKEQVESGEITVDSILAQAKSYAFQATEATEASKNQLNNLKEQWQEKAEALDDSEEIVIDITEE
ncbi:TPA: YtxH domain-containing protein [Streptococcus pneumoniae]